jgi:hypothetical protein
MFAAVVRASMLPLVSALLLAAAPATRAQSPAPTFGTAAPADDRDFERQLYRTRFEHEVKFRAAAIQVAWAAETLCHATVQIEPFVLWSTFSMRQRLPDEKLKLFRQITGMDEKWRIVWTDESAPEELELRSVVTAINGRKLPAGGTNFAFTALLRGGDVMSNDDQGLWDVILKAREEAGQGKPMTVTLEDGKTVQVETQTGCAGSVTASSFDNDPDVFWRQGTKRAKIPANAMIEASSRDEFLWLAAFGTYFQASEKAKQQVSKAEGASTGFLVGKILLLTVPGAGMLLTAAEAQAEKALVVDSIVGNADLFANEVVASLGGDPGAGLKLTERLLARGVKADAVMMDEFRRSTAAEHAKQIRGLQAAQANVEREKERIEARKAQEDAVSKASDAAAAAAAAVLGTMTNPPQRKP